MTKEKKFSPSKISHFPRWGVYPLNPNAVWKSLPVVTFEQSFVKHL